MIEDRVWPRARPRRKKFLQHIRRRVGKLNRLDRFLRTLRNRIERFYGLNRLTEKIDAVRRVGRVRKNIQNPAAQRIFAAHLHLAHAVVPGLRQKPAQLDRVMLVARTQHDLAAGVVRRFARLLQRRDWRENHQALRRRIQSRLDVAQPLGRQTPPRESHPFRPVRFRRQDIPSREQRRLEPQARLKMRGHRRLRGNRRIGPRVVELQIPGASLLLREHAGTRLQSGMNGLLARQKRAQIRNRIQRRFRPVHHDQNQAGAMRLVSRRPGSETARQSVNPADAAAKDREAPSSPCTAA